MGFRLDRNSKGILSKLILTYLNPFRIENFAKTLLLKSNCPKMWRQTRVWVGVLKVHDPRSLDVVDRPQNRFALHEGHCGVPWRCTGHASGAIGIGTGKNVTRKTYHTNLIQIVESHCWDFFRRSPLCTESWKFKAISYISQVLVFGWQADASSLRK